MAKRYVEEDEVGQTTMQMPSRATKAGKVRYVGIECADNGYMVSVEREPAGKKRPMVMGDREKHVAKDLDDLDEVLDGLFGVKD